MYQNGYQQYKMQSVNTMTHSEMLLLLYDELIKRLTRAQIALGNKDYDLFEKSVQRSREIVRYLDETLNMEYSMSSGMRLKKPVRRRLLYRREKSYGEQRRTIDGDP